MSNLFLIQAKDIVIMLYCGLTVQMLYDILNFYRRKKPHARWFFVSSELVFWLLAALLASWFLYYCCYGKLSIHAFLAMVAGMLLWRFCVGRKISTLIRNTCGIIKGNITCKDSNRRDKKYGKKKKKPAVQRQKSGHRY